MCHISISTWAVALVFAHRSRPLAAFSPSIPALLAVLRFGRELAHLLRNHHCMRPTYINMAVHYICWEMGTADELLIPPLSRDETVSLSPDYLCISSYESYSTHNSELLGALLPGTCLPAFHCLFLGIGTRTTLARPAPSFGLKEQVQH